MSSSPSPEDRSRLRVADTDRDRAAEALRRAAAEGRLTMDELDERIGLAYKARTYADLQALTSDLPGSGAAVAQGTPAGLSEPSPAVPGARLSLAVMSGVKRAGPWVVPPAYTAVAVMGGVELDLRYARFSARETTIRAFCLMGGVSITVSPDAEVDVSGVGFLGGFDHQASGPGVPGAPRIRVIGFALMGGVEVKRKSPAGPGGRN